MSIFFSFHEEMKVLKKLILSDKWSIIAFFLSLVSILITTITFKSFSYSVKHQSDYTTQLNTLSDVEKNLYSLINFIENQKKTLNESQDFITKLKDEENKLRPIVEADRNLVNAILMAQSARQKANIWKERIIAFFIGVMASVVAAFIYSAVHSYPKKA